MLILEAGVCSGNSPKQSSYKWPIENFVGIDAFLFALISLIFCLVCFKIQFWEELILFRSEFDFLKLDLIEFVENEVQICESDGDF